MEHSNKPRGKVSVCMATFNGAPFIREQVNSILSQLGSKDEIVVSDDGSTDYTLAILESYHDSRIKILNHKERKNNPWKAWGGIKNVISYQKTLITRCCIAPATSYS